MSDHHLPYTNRENELLRKINGITEDYSDAEIVRALGRRLIYMSYGVMQPPALQVEREWALIEGFNMMSQYRLAGISHTVALLLTCGMLTAIAAVESTSGWETLV